MLTFEYGSEDVSEAGIHDVRLDVIMANYTEKINSEVHFNVTLYELVNTPTIKDKEYEIN